eukprot:623607-Prorocentrum_minimum.AAC.1
MPPRPLCTPTLPLQKQSARETKTDSPVGSSELLGRHGSQSVVFDRTPETGAVVLTSRGVRRGSGGGQGQVIYIPRWVLEGETDRADWRGFLERPCR